MCDHETFESAVEVTRLTAVEGGPVTGFSAAVRVRCTGCGEPFMWVGVPVGASPRQPMSSRDGREMRAPLRPMSSEPGFGEDGPAVSLRVAP